jgi:hypothetical protein
MDFESIVSENDKRLSVHEAICAERYEGIQKAFSKGNQRMAKIEYLMYALIAAVLLGPNLSTDLIKLLIK